jgi:uncharacterized protein YndB with AHSA1/START domain
MFEILHILTIRAEPSTVYSAITEENGIALWWTDQVKARPEENTIAEFSFGEKYHNKMRVSKLEKNRVVEWLVLEGHEEWLETKISFNLEMSGDNTIVRFNHCNWRRKTDFFAHCNYNWAWYLNSLRLYCETGEGLPYQTRPDHIP